MVDPTSPVPAASVLPRAKVSEMVTEMAAEWAHSLNPACEVLVIVTDDRGVSVVGSMGDVLGVLLMAIDAVEGQKPNRTWSTKGSTA